jgi:lipid-A-disaccharide synthase
MRQAGVETLVDSHQVSMVGITEVVRGLPRAYRAFQSLVSEVDRRRPRLAVLIDFPSFNLRMAKRLKLRKIPVVYFVSPQIWAWKKWRINQIKACVDKMLCIFDFEEAIYRKASIPVEYVGHPLVDLVRPHLSRREFIAKAGLQPNVATVALLPGSREIEVSFNLPRMLDAATRLAISRKVQFVLAVAPTLDAGWLESMLAHCYVGRAAVRAMTHATYDALQHSDVAVVASGTATLEAALRECPMVVVYRVSAITAWLARFMIDVPFYSMVNLLAAKPVAPELIQSEFTPQNLANRVAHLLDHPEAREEMVKEFRALKPRLGPSGAIQRAGEAVVALLERSEATLPVS